MDKLLPVVDDFERAMENLPPEISEHIWLEGIQLVQRKLLTMLENFNVAPIEALGEPFDPNLHEAITQEPTDEYESGSVCRVLQTGYKIGDRVIRPSLVVVAM
jgi:molecular chaperone GrpE